MYNFKDLNDKFDTMTTEELIAEFIKVEELHHSASIDDEDFEDLDEALIFLGIYLAGCYAMDHGFTPSWVRN